MKIEDYDKIGVDKSVLTFFGDANILVQVWRNKDEKGEVSYTYDNYMPRKNRVSTTEETTDEKDVLRRVRESIERLKILQYKMQEFLDGKTDCVYYASAEDEYDELFKKKLI